MNLATAGVSPTRRSQRPERRRTTTGSRSSAGKLRRDAALSRSPMVNDITLALSSAPKGTQATGTRRRLKISRLQTATASCVVETAAAFQECPAEWSSRRTWSWTGDTAAHATLVRASGMTTSRGAPAVPTTAARIPITAVPSARSKPWRNDWSSSRRRRGSAYAIEPISPARTADAWVRRPS
jgi:hypothetical protein